MLCSLLLGFGLDAYVCVGTKTKGAAHAWVMTVSPDQQIMFWESLTGHRYVFVDFLSRIMDGMSSLQFKEFIDLPIPSQAAVITRILNCWYAQGVGWNYYYLDLRN